MSNLKKRICAKSRARDGGRSVRKFVLTHGPGDEKSTSRNDNPKLWKLPPRLGPSLGKKTVGEKHVEKGDDKEHLCRVEAAKHKNHVSFKNPWHETQVVIYS